ncbi:MAG: MoxR family ATPase [Pseudomonadota bacterium]
MRAIEAALLADRPLLLRGEPGVGKTQFAQAVAKALERAFVSKTVGVLTEAHALLWEEDHVGRLAEAQLASVLSQQDVAVVRGRLRIARFVRPGPLWWTFNWDDACNHMERNGIEEIDDARRAAGAKGVVVLIDEIDKAETALPNALLEALGSRVIRPPGCEPVSAASKPLIILASNQLRPLSAAFMRRCLSHRIRLPKGDALVEHLVVLGQAHFPKHAVPDATDELLKQAAQFVAGDRAALAEKSVSPLPGVAEYIDLLSALFDDARDPAVSATEALSLLRPYFLDKASDASE